MATLTNIDQIADQTLTNVEYSAMHYLWAEDVNPWELDLPWQYNNPHIVLTNLSLD